MDLEKAYDKINRGMIPPLLRHYHVPEELITMVMALYRTPSTQLRTCFGKTKSFPVKVGLHQRSALSPLLFIILLDYISKQCPMERGQKVIYADDIALGTNIKEELQQAVEKWDNQLAVHGMRMSKEKTEVLEVSRGQPVPRLQITLDGQQLKQTTAFRYLGSWLHESGDLDREVQARLQGTGNTWRNVSGIIYDKRMPMRLKTQVYKTMVRPVILYGAETWAVKEEHVKKLEVAEMRCLRAIRGVTRRERMRNEDIRQELKVTELREKIRESRLRWYGHVKRMEENEFVRWAAERREPGTRKRGRPRKRWMDCVRDDGRVVDLDKVDDRIEWREVSRRPDPP